MLSAAAAAAAAVARAAQFAVEFGCISSCESCLTAPPGLQEYGVLPVLYASTWLLTAFACPFPFTFAGRVIDVMLLERRTHPLLRTALAVMAEVEAELLELADFEALIGHLKVRSSYHAPQANRHLYALAHAPPAAYCPSCHGRGGGRAAGTG